MNLRQDPDFAVQIVAQQKAKTPRYKSQHGVEEIWILVLAKRLFEVFVFTKKLFHSVNGF